MIKINVDTSQIESLIQRLNVYNPEARAKAIGRGVSKVAKSGGVAATRQIAKEYAVKKTVVAKRFAVRMRGKQLAELVAKSRTSKSSRIPVLDFGAKQLKSGVTFRIAKGGKRQKLKHAFIATMASGHQGVFQREYGGRTIKEVMGIDLTQMLTGKRVAPEVVRRINEQLPKVMRHELEWELKRAGFK